MDVNVEWKYDGGRDAFRESGDVRKDDILCERSQEISHNAGGCD